MADVNPDFLAHQVSRLLDESRAMRAEMRELREGNVNLGRLLEHTREDLIISMKTELTAQFLSFENRLDARIANAIEEGLRGKQR
jgi:hypothetical protein